jgi:D-alanyl-D-alanine carboxypeptidase (penicillin-binding protein 5/6)
VIIQSGNDACIALADTCCRQSGFFHWLDEWLRAEMGLTNTTFKTVHGLDAPGSSAPRATWRCWGKR